MEKEGKKVFLASVDIEGMPDRLVNQVDQDKLESKGKRVALEIGYDSQFYK